MGFACSWSFEKLVESADAQTLHWEDLKAAERAEKKAARADQSILADVPFALPALMRAEKLQKRAARVGFDWPEVSQVFDKIDEEIIEIKEEIEIDGSVERLCEEVGDLLFAVANLARHLKVDPEVALRGGNDKFEKRFRAVEAKFGDELEKASLEEMEEAWQQVKLENG